MNEQAKETDRGPYKLLERVRTTWKQNYIRKHEVFVVFHSKSVNLLELILGTTSFYMLFCFSRNFMSGFLPEDIMYLCI